jgi:hypothetical protein
MHTSRQHLRLIFEVVSEQHDLLCGACGCPELRMEPSAEFCVDHQREVQAFQRWLAGTDKVCWPVASSFDFERSFLSARQRPA